MQPPQSTYPGVDNLEVMELARNYNRFLLQAVLQHCRGARTAVDFGSGLGSVAAELRRRGVEVVCIEQDHGLLLKLREAGLEAHAGLDEVGSRGFDCGYSLNVLEHIDDDRAALRQLFLALRPGGRLFLYVPAMPVLFSSMDRKVGHRRRYSRNGLASRLRETGFAVEAVEHADCLGVAATMVYKWVGSAKGDLDPRAIALYDRVGFPISRLMDRALKRWLGKNLWAVARRPEER
jgi:SAM-dependent methyltransferase